MGGWWFVGAWRLPDRYKQLHLLREDADGLPSKFRRKVVPKLWYFTVNAGAVFFLPFLSLYWRDSLGFTTPQIGLIQALRPWVSAFTTNIISPLADVWDAHYAMLVLTYAITITSRGLITMGWAFGPMLALALVMEAAVAPMSVLVDATVVAGSTKDGTYGRARLWASVGWGVFAPVAGVVIAKTGIHTSFMAFAGIYASAAVWTLLVPAGLLSARHKAHQLRGGAGGASATSSAASSPEGSTAGGQAGAPSPAALAPVPDAAEAAAVAGHNVISVAATGLTADTVSRRASKASSHHSAQHVVVSVEADGRSAGAADAPAAAPAAAAPGAPAPAPEVVAVVQLVELGKAPADAKEGKAGAPAAAAAAPPPEEPLWPGLKRLFSDVYVITFMFIAFLMGVGNGFIGYLFLLLSDLGASGTLLGACLTMNCIGEVPFFYYSGAIIKKIGVYPALNIGMAAYCLRLGCYALLPYFPSLWIVLPVELLQGLTFGLAYSAGTVHCRRIAPRNLRSTVQSIFSGLYTGVGAGVGGLAGGMLLGAVGGQWTCVAAAGALTAGWAAANAANLGHYLRTGARRVRRVGTALGSQVRGSFARLSPSGWGGGTAAAPAPV